MLNKNDSYTKSLKSSFIYSGPPSDKKSQQQEDEDLFDDSGICSHCAPKYGRLRETLRGYAKELKSFKYLLSFKVMALKNREEMLEKFISENNQLKDKVRTLEKLAERLKVEKTELKTSKKGEVLSFLPPMTRGANGYGQSILQPTSSSLSRSQVRFSMPFPGDDKELKKRADSSEKKSDRASMSNLLQGSSSMKKKRASSISTKLLTFSKKVSSVVTVTDTQGMPEDHTLFSNNDGRLNILLMNEDRYFEENTKLDYVEQLVFQSEDLIKTLADMPIDQQIDTVDIFKCMIKDFKRMMKLTIRLKKVIKSILNMNSSIMLEDALSSIIQETCEILHCDRATLFIIDELNNELWSKIGKNMDAIRIPLGKGIVGQVATTGKIIKIDDAYLDSRFNKEVDKANKYTTKTILCAPIQDVEGKNIAVLEAINKIHGVFNNDDSTLLGILCNIAGSLLKNSLLYDRILINQHKLYKFSKTVVEIFNQSDLFSFQLKVEEKIKEILSGDKAIFYFVLPQRGVFRFNEDTGEIKTYEIFGGIVQQSMNDKTVCEVIEPGINKDFNPLFDLDTDLPIITCPVLSRNGETLYGIFQGVNLKSNVERTLGTPDTIDSELTRSLSIIIFYALHNLLAQIK